MNRLALLAAIFVMLTGLALAQNTSPATTDNQNPAAASDQMQQQSQPPTRNPGDRNNPDNPASMNPDRSTKTPESTLPSTTIDDQQPGNSTTGSPSSTMGTTGATPGAEPSASGNQSGNLPSDTQTPKGDVTQKPKTDTEPHGKYSSGSSNPASSSNGANSNDTTGTTPHPDNSTNSANPQTTPPHIATHVPDAGTQMNPASLAVVTAEKN